MWVGKMTEKSRLNMIINIIYLVKTVSVFFSFTDCRTKCDMSLGIIDDDCLNQNVLGFILTC